MRLPSGNVRRIFLYAIGAGVAIGFFYYGIIHTVGRMLAPSFAALVALGLGIVIGCCFLVAAKYALRLAAYDLRHTASNLTGQPLHHFTTGVRDEFTALRTTLTRALALHPDTRLHSTIAQSIADSPADMSQRFGAAIATFTQTIALQGAALCQYDSSQAICTPICTWGLPLMQNISGMPTDEGPLRRIVRDGRDIVLAGVEARLIMAMLGLGELTPLPIVCLPMWTNGELIGILLLISDKQDIVWSPERRELARSLASQLSMAMSEERLCRRLMDEQRNLNLFIDLSYALTSDRQIDSILERMLRIAATLSDSEHGTLLLLDRDEEVRYRIALTRGTLVPLQLVARSVLRSGLAGWALRERRADIIIDTQRDARWLPIPGLDGMRSALVVPVMHEDRVFALLTLAHGAVHHYNDQALRMIRALAGQIVHIVAHSQLVEHIEQEQRHNNHQLDSHHTLLAHVPSLLFEELKRDGMLETLAQPRYSQAIALSVGLRNISQLSKTLGPETLIQDVIQPFAQVVMKTAREHYSYLDHCDAHGALLLFNYPRHTSDAADQAAATAQQLHDAFAQLRQRWRTTIHCDVVLTIGIARGDIITGQTSSDSNQGQYVVIGPAVSEAQHLQMLARPGEVLCNAAFVGAFNQSHPESEGYLFEALQPLPNGQKNDQPPYRFTKSTQGAV